MTPILSINSNSVTIYWPSNSKTIVINKGDLLYNEKLFNLIKDENFDDLYSYVTNTKIEPTECSDLKISIEQNCVFYNGEKLESNYLINKIIDISRDGGLLDPITNFLKKVYNNPSKTAIDELFIFVEDTKLALFPDGDIAAYKMVRSDYKDIFSNTCDYSIGKTVKMPRNKVNDNRNITCSSGLHFCSKNYIPAAYGFDRHNRMILVKINPENVVCIPRDYDNQKARACEITSYEDITNMDEINDIYEKYTVISDPSLAQSQVDFNSYITAFKDAWRNDDLDIFNDDDDYDDDDDIYYGEDDDEINSEDQESFSISDAYKNKPNILD